MHAYGWWRGTRLGQGQEATRLSRNASCHFRHYSMVGRQLGKKIRECGARAAFELATLTCWEEEKDDENWRRRKESPWSYKKSKLEARLYIQKSHVKKRMMRFPSHHKRPRILHCFSSSQERNRLIVAPDYDDDLRKSTASLKRGAPFTDN
jgi:hypothetical protein